MDFIEDGGSSGALVQDSAAFDGLVGQTIANKFRLVKRIGAGAMGRVYQAEQLSLGKMVAIKILRHELMADEKLVRRFELEARTASAVSHPNLIETFDCGRDAALDLAYIAMELLPGPDLSLVIAREAPLPLPRCARIMDQVLGALEEAHARGIVHRDLKPGNIMFAPRREEPDFVKVCDFGIAKVKSDRQRPSLTMAGLVFGTPEYMSPEQACGGDVDARTDLYSVGAILYQMVTGHLPFPAPSPTEVLARILRDEPERPSLRAFTVIPDAIEALILRAMSKDREKRLQSASEFRVALRDAWAGNIDYWPGQSTALPAMPRRSGTTTGLTPSSVIASRTPTPTSERPTPRAMPQVTAAPPPGTSAAPPPSSTPTPGAPAGGGHGSQSAPPPGRPPGRAAVLGFTLTIACGGIALLIVSATRGPAPASQPASTAAAPEGEAVATAPAGGIIVVPTAPPSHGGGADGHRSNGTAHAPVAHRDPRANARVVPHQKAGGHHLYDPRAYGVSGTSSGSASTEPAVAARAPSSPAAEPSVEPPPTIQPPTTVPSTSGGAPGPAASRGVAHKLRATSIPSEAEVLVDGKVIGKTPLFGAEIDVSQSHTLTIRKDGYAPLEQTVSASSAWVVRASDNVAALRVAAVLQKAVRLPVPTAQFQNKPAAPVAAATTGVAPAPSVLAATSHKLRITSIPSDAQVSIDGKVMGKTPLFGSDVDMSRPHRLTIRKDGYALYEQTITASSEWSIRPSDPTSALLRIQALLKPGDPTLAQNPP